MELKFSMSMSSLSSVESLGMVVSLIGACSDLLFV